jgi:tetratricopeptide (TPR) repeat protein
MTKIPSDKLYRLVRVLSGPERRYFRIFIRGKTERDNKYLLMFDALAEMDKFEEEEVKRQVYQDQPPSARTAYPQMKAYLYDLVIKCLESYDENRSVERRISQMLQGVAVLFKRGLYDDCLDLLRRAARMARQYEAFAQQLEVIQWQKQLAYTRMDADFLHKNLEQLLFDEQRALEQLRNAAQYRKAFFQVYATTLQRASLQRGEGTAKRLQNIVNQEHFSNPDLATSHKARVMYYRTLNVYHYGAMQFEEFYQSGKTLIALLESQPHFLQENLADYIAALSNLILSCGLLRKYDEVRECLQKLRSLRPITEDDRRKIHRQYFNNLFVLCIYTGEFAEAYQEMERCQREAALFDPHDYETASFFFQYALICFGNGDYGGALQHLNHWLSQPRSAEREDLQSLARILLLIVHYEMGNTLLIESLLRSARRFLRIKNRFSELEKRFMRLIADLVKSTSAQEREAAFQKMKADLEQETVLPAVRTLLQTFDLGMWVECKLSRQPFAAAVRDKFEGMKFEV